MERDGTTAVQLPDGVHAGRFEQLGVLRTDRADAHEVGPIGKLKQVVDGDGDQPGQAGSVFRCSAFQQKGFLA